MNYEEKKQARIERLKNRASNARAKSNDFHESASKMASAIPFGQPILIGHHSEKSDRSYRNKIENKFRKSFEEQKKANYYEEKAKAAENNKSIYSDDPEAVKKLKEKLEVLEKRQELYKSLNKIIKRKKGTQKEKVQEIIKLGLSEENAYKLFTPDFAGRAGIPSFELSNNNASIRRLKKRIEEETAKAQDTTKEEIINGIKILDNVEENRVQIFFDSIPNEETRKKLKSNGFRWSRFNKAWQRHRSNQALYLAKQIVGAGA